MSIEYSSYKQSGKVAGDVYDNIVSGSLVIITDELLNYYLTYGSLSAFEYSIDGGGSYYAGTLNKLQTVSGEELSQSQVSLNNIERRFYVNWDAGSDLEGIKPYDKVVVRQLWSESGSDAIYTSQSSTPVSLDLRGATFRLATGFLNLTGSEVTCEFWAKLKNNDIAQNEGDAIVFSWQSVPKQAFTINRTNVTSTTPSYSLNFLTNQVQLDIGSFNYDNFHHIAWTWKVIGGTSYVASWLDGALIESKSYSYSQLPIDTVPFPGDWWYWSYYRAPFGILNQVRVSSTYRYSGSFTPAVTLQPDDDTVGLWNMADIQGDGRNVLNLKTAIFTGSDIDTSPASITVPTYPTGQQPVVYNTIVSGTYIYTPRMNIAFTSSANIKLNRPYPYDDDFTVSFQTLVAPVTHRNHFTLFYSTESGVYTTSASTADSQTDWTVSGAAFPAAGVLTATGSGETLEVQYTGLQALTNNDTYYLYVSKSSTGA